jgi:hypothetical protein
VLGLVLGLGAGDGAGNGAGDGAGDTMGRQQIPAIYVQTHSKNMSLLLAPIHSIPSTLRYPQHFDTKAV